MGDKAAPQTPQVDESPSGARDTRSAVAAVPGYSVEHLEPPKTHPRRSSSGARRPDSTWKGTVRVDDLEPFGVAFSARDVGGTLVLDSLTIEYSTPWPELTYELDDAGQVDTDSLRSRGGLASDVAALDGGITSEYLRRLSLPKLIAAIRHEAIARGLDSRWDLPDGETLIDALQATADLYRPAKRRRARRIGDDQLRTVAEMRLQLDAERHSSPVVEIAVQLGYSVDTVRDRLNRATEAGWLARATKGARRRTPGPALIKAREEEQNERADET